MHGTALTKVRWSVEMTRCCFCGKQISEREGNNPEPLASGDKVCCNACNMRVIEYRIEQIKKIKKVSKKY